MKLFISYSNEDAKIVVALEKFLTRHGIMVLRDKNRFKLGEIIPEKIEKDIEECDHMLLIWSEFSKKSDYVHFEIQTSLSKNKPICPCLLDETRLHFLINQNTKTIKLENSEDSFRQIVDEFKIDMDANFNALDDAEVKLKIQIYLSKMVYIYSAFPVLHEEDCRNIDDYFIDLKLSPFSSKEGYNIETRKLLNYTNNNKFIIVGKPGTGKTSLLRHLTYLVSAKANGIIPIFARLQNFGAENSFSEFIEQEAQKDVIESINILRIDDIYDKFIFYIFLDGLDELKHGLFEIFIKEIHLFITKYSKVKIFISSRIDYFLEDKEKEFYDWLKFRINPLSDSDISNFISLWHSEVEKNALIKSISDSFRLKELAQIPFLLTLICLVYKKGDNLIDKRSILYSQATEFLISSRTFDDEKKKIYKKVLCLLSFTFIKIQEFKFKEEFAYAVIENYFDCSYRASKLLKELVTNTGLIQFSDSYYQFTHLSLQEYFAALYLTSLSDITNTLAHYANIPSWEEPIKLFVGLIDDKSLQQEYIKSIWDYNSCLSLRILTECQEVAPVFLKTLIQNSDSFERHKLISNIEKTLSRLKTNEVTFFLIETIDPLLTYETDNSILYFIIMLLKKVDPDDKSKLLNKFYFKDRDALLNQLGLESKYNLVFLTIPSGKFNMGDNISIDKNEQPEHLVNISSFKIAKYQLTNIAFEKIMKLDETRRNDYSLEDDQPVININWYDAFICAFKIGCRLPTEAEWEYAARAGSTSNWCFGNDESQLKDYANYYDIGASKTRNVTEGKANAFGLHNVHGNVWEWCSDWFTNYSSHAAKDPQGPSNGKLRVRRGGGWLYHARGCRCAFRYGNEPEYSYNDIGVRLVIQ